MEALLRKAASSSSCTKSCKALYQQVWKRNYDYTCPPPPSMGRLRLHPDWKHMGNKIRRIESRISDFRILCNEVRIQKNRLEEVNGAYPTGPIEALIKEKEAQVLSERAAIINDLKEITGNFVEGGTREYASIRKFFLVYVHKTIRCAFDNLSDMEFEKLLTESPDGISFDVPAARGATKVPAHLCKIIADAGRKLFVAPSDICTSAGDIALAILQAPHHKHCVAPHCKREDCIAVKSQYEELFEAFFKEKARAISFQKARGEESAFIEAPLSFPVKQIVEKRPEQQDEPEQPVKKSSSLRIG